MKMESDIEIICRDPKPTPDAKDRPALSTLVPAFPPQIDRILISVQERLKGGEVDVVVHG